jgi:hypothetical protein
MRDIGMFAVGALLCWGMTHEITKCINKAAASILDRLGEMQEKLEGIEHALER